MTTRSEPKPRDWRTLAVTAAPAGWIAWYWSARPDAEPITARVESYDVDLLSRSTAPLH